MTEEQNRPEELVDRLRVIEAQPLSDRPGAYAALHDELARRLETKPVEPPAAE